MSVSIFSAARIKRIKGPELRGRACRNDLKIHAIVEPDRLVALPFIAFLFVYVLNPYQVFCRWVFMPVRANNFIWRHFAPCRFFRLPIEFEVNFVIVMSLCMSPPDKNGPT